ncbi:hypothetical protein RHM65_04570 [Pseudomonas sp. CCI4.2]|uniref:hypothetical protein n=1 Tax=Pseudomonas sp. CCI4.2 TaxID=3048620 RepID=UPI002AC8B0C4|nr:hypothetical protein [Pseudomonas sp. CCI4.2]MEB0091791.1 hypothetical protein [Pseudomonas sp. CCI4.2]WPX54857.1 hypothetical protein RHM65_04570 [Pseudomonas sp. CCI4.2]
MTTPDMKLGDSSLKMKRGVSEHQRRQVLDLRRRHSLREVAEATGLPLGTVKTIVSRSGVFRDNEAHRTLFCLPPITVSAETLPSVPELPPQQRVTGDKEVDAVLWLRSVIKTGNSAHIETALAAAKRIKTPLDELEKRYSHLLSDADPGNWAVVFKTIGFANLEGLARSAIADQHAREEGRARFGDRAMFDTDAEVFCAEVLDGAKIGQYGSIDEADIAVRFKGRPDLMPCTLADCLYELDYWHKLYRLRCAFCDSSTDAEGPQEASSREHFVFGLLAEIRPRHKDEAKAVLRYLVASDRRDTADANRIIENLIG